MKSMKPKKSTRRSIKTKKVGMVKNIKRKQQKGGELEQDEVVNIASDVVTEIVGTTISGNFSLGKLI